MRQPDTSGSATGPTPRTDQAPAQQQPQQRGPRRLRLTPAEHPARRRPKPLGVTLDDRGEGIGLAVADARHHLHVQGVTGSGKSTWLANHVLDEAAAGRGVALLDCQGDLARNVLDRLPARCGDRLIILDPAETDAPAAWNVLAPAPGAATANAGREWAAENVVGVFRQLYHQWWGPRMDDVMRAACLTLARRPGSTLADVIPILTRPSFRRELLAQYGEPDGLDGFWDGFDQLTVGQRAQLCGPILSRLRGVLSRRFARDLLGAARSTINLTDVLDGGILIARLAKGEIGENTAQMVGSLLLSGLWSHAIRRSALPPDKRRDATIVVDECHNFLHLPIGVDDTLAEARGYRISLVLAHQHLAQLPVEVREAVNANARNKIFFTVSPDDAAKLVRHVTPYFADTDLCRRGAFEIVARIVNHGHDTAPFTVASEPLPPAIPGRAEALRAAARARTGLPVADRTDAEKRQRLATAPGAPQVRPAQPGPAAPAGPTVPTQPSDSPPHSLPHSVPHSLPRLGAGQPTGTPWPTKPQVDRNWED
jgi:hypothetical protein